MGRPGAATAATGLPPPRTTGVRCVFAAPFSHQPSHADGHTFDSGSRAPREQRKRLDGLLGRHAAAVDRQATRGPSATHQLGLQWEVDDLRDPQVRAQQLGRHGASGVGGHTGRRDVRDAHGAVVERGGQVGADRDATVSVEGVHAVGEQAGPGLVEVEA